MRRAALVALALLVFAPDAGAAEPCGVTTTPVVGSAPLAVTFSAGCAAASYTWSFGDGEQAVGQSAQHVYGPGAWRPTLATEHGTEQAQPVTAVSLTLTAPKVARYAQFVTLRAQVVPRVPVTLRGRPFVAGKLRVRVLGAAPWVARALETRATARTLVTPRLVVRAVGTPVVGGRVRVVATLHPASAGKVVAPRTVPTDEPGVVRVRARSLPAVGWRAVAATASVTIVTPDLAPGSRGTAVRALEQRLAALRYAIRQDGSFGSEDLEAVYAFQKVNGLARTGRVDAALWGRLLAARVPAARYGGDHVEIDRTRQVLFVVRGGKVTLVVATSTGATGNTPLGRWQVYRKVAGFDWVLYYPSYFLRGFAVHGYPDVPPYPASHGCARLPMWVAQTVYALMPEGSSVYVYP